jgi:hypothetical protein
MYRDEILKDLLEFINNSGVDPDSLVYKRALWALHCIESNDILGDE